MLTQAPDLNSINVTGNETSLPSSNSSTGWIQFASVLSAYGLTFGRSDTLQVFNAKSFLAVHRYWLLIIGVLGRYAERPDLGVAMNSDLEPGDFATGQQPLSGLTGLLQAEPDSGTDADDGGIHKVIFRAHLARQIESREEDVISLTTLLYLYFGFLPSNNGTLYFIPLQVERRNKRGYTRYRGAKYPVKLFKVSRGASLYDCLGVSATAFATAVGLQVENIASLEPVARPSSADKVILQHADSFDERNPSSPLFHINFDWTKRRPVFLKREIAPIVAAFLDLRWSSRNFLFGLATPEVAEWRRSYRHDALLTQLFGFDGRLPQILGHGLRVLPATDYNAASLSRAMENAIKMPADRLPAHSSGDRVTNTNIGSSIRNWSRSACQAFCSLDEEIRVICKTSQVDVKAVAILYLMDEGFRKLVLSSNADNPETLRSGISLNFKDNAITVPSVWESSTKYYFDFDHAFVGDDATELHQLATENPDGIRVNYPQMILSCLQAHLRTALWCMVFPSHDLNSMIDSMQDVVEISADSTSLYRRIRGREPRSRGHAVRRQQEDGEFYQEEQEASSSNFSAPARSSVSSGLSSDSSSRIRGSGREERSSDASSGGES